MEIRPLRPPDAVAYRELRLRSLRDHPEAFGAAYEEEAALGEEQVAAQLRDGPPLVFHAGAFVDATLAGFLVLSRYGRRKLSHRAIVSGMYVAPEHRGQGAGTALLEAVLSHARSTEGLEDLVLAVTVGNTSARGLYLAAGFVPYGVEPRLIAVGECRFDVEWMHLSLR